MCKNAGPIDFTFGSYTILVFIFNLVENLFANLQPHHRWILILSYIRCSEFSKQI